MKTVVKNPGKNRRAKLLRDQAEEAQEAFRILNQLLKNGFDVQITQYKGPEHTMKIVTVTRGEESYRTVEWTAMQAVTWLQFQVPLLIDLKKSGFDFKNPEIYC